MGDKEKELAGGEPLTTNNRMELMAAIKGLEALKKPCRVKLHTDSIYVRDGITRWVHNWQRNGWRTSDKKTGQECRALAGADHGLRPASNRVEMGQRPQRPRGERSRRRDRLRGGG